MPSRSTLVIDIGTGSLKLLHIERGKDKPIIRQDYIEEFPPEIQEKLSLEKEILGQYLKDAISKSEIKTKDVILILPDYATDLALLTLPKQTKEELKTSLKWELRDHISYPAEEAYFDYRIIKEFTEEGVSKMSFFIAAVQRAEIDKYLGILNGLGLNPISFTIGFTSFGPIIKNSNLIEKDEEYVVVDVGARTTKLGVFKEGYLQFYKKIDLGSREVTLSLMNESTDFNKAEDLKRRIGVSSIGEEGENIDTSEIEAAQRNFGLARPVLERLSSEILQFINFYKESLKGGSIKKLFIFGGGARLKGLRTFLSSTLGINIFSPDPFTEVVKEGIDSHKLEEESPIFARAWGAFVKDISFINLLPEEIRFKKKIAFEQTLIRISSFALAAVLMLVYIEVINKGRGLEKRLSSKRLQFEEVGPAREKIDELENNRELLQKRMDLCVELLSKDPFWEDILKEIGRLIPPNIILSKIAIQKARGGKERDFFAAPVKTKEGVVLTLEGTVYPSEFTMERSLTGFLTKISDSRYFYDTKLKISKENKTDDKVVTDFIIESRIKESL